MILLTERCFTKKDFKYSYKDALDLAKAEGFETITDMFLVMTEEHSVRELERRWGFSDHWIKNKMRILGITINERGGANNKWGRWGNPKTYIERYQMIPTIKKRAFV